MGKRIIALILSALLLLPLVACGNVSGGSTSTKNEVPRMTPEETLDIMNELLDLYNEENKYHPVENLEIEFEKYFSNGHLQYTFSYEVDEDGNINELYISFLGKSGTYKSGMQTLDGFLNYVSLMICIYAPEKEIDTIWDDAKDFYGSHARDGGIEASNGVTFEWSNLSSEYYWLTAKAILP